MKLSRNFKTASLALAVLWIVFLANYLLPVDLRLYGIRPRRIDGLSGILFSPFLHVNLRHLIANSFALFFLLFLSLSLDKKMTGLALIIIILLGGGGVWLFGRPHTVHIGASGVIFGLLGFMLFAGIFQRRWKALFFSLAVFLLYGGLLLTLLVQRPGVSWTGHFFGFLAGVAAAWATRSTKHR